MRRKKSQKKSRRSSTQAVSEKRRMFIDPASISSGWAIYLGKELEKSGTIAVDKKFNVFVRLMHLSALYRQLMVSGSVDEVHIELLPRRCHHFTHWSVGVIGSTLQAYGGTISSDIAVKSWQKWTDWERKSAKWRTLGYKSEDEFAAVEMGRFWTEKNL